MIRHILGWTWYIGAALLVLLAIVIGVARMVVSSTEDIPRRVEEQASALLGTPVIVEEVTVGWRGLSPVIELRRVSVLDAVGGQAGFSARSVRLSFHLLRGLLWGDWWPAGVSVSGTLLQLERREDGRVVIAGFPEVEDAPDVLALLLAEDWFEVRDSVLQWTDRISSRPPLVVQRIDLRVINRGDKHSVRAAAVLPEAWGRRVTVMGDVRIDPDNTGDVSGRVYADAVALHLDRWAEELAGGLKVQGDADVSMWLSLDNGRLVELQSSIEAGAFVVDQREGGQLVAGDGFSGRLRWARREGGWTLDLDELMIEREGQVRLPNRVRLDVADLDDDAGRHWRGMIGELTLERAAPMLRRTGLLNSTPFVPLLEAQPEGEVQDLHFQFDQRDGDIHALRVRGGFRHLGLDAVGKMPGFRGLSGRIEGGPDSGVLELFSAGTVLRVPGLFREPLLTSTLEGRIDWHRQGERLGVESEQLLVVTGDIVTETRLKLGLDLQGTDHQLDIHTDFRDGVASATGRYLPAGIMPAKAVRWLDRAFGAGTITSGSLDLQGPASAFPFDNGEGRFLVAFDVSDMLLDYQQGWAPIKALDAHVKFAGRGMEIRTREGRISNSTLMPTTARIENLNHATLEINGRVDGPVADMLGVVRASPLSDAYGDALGPVELTGPGRLQLDMQFPLEKPDAPNVVNGQVEMRAGVLNLPEWGARATGLAGTVSFDADGPLGGQLAGQFMQRPVELRINPGGRPGQAARFAVTGRWQASDWAPGEWVSGDTGWNLRLDIPARVAGQPPRPVAVRLDSAMRGVGLDLPAPLGKSAGESRSLVVQTSVIGGRAQPLRFNYDDTVFGLLELREIDGRSAISRGEIRLGSPVQRLTPEPGLHLSGAWPELELERLPAMPAAGGDAVLRSADLSFGVLGVHGLRYEDVRLVAHREAPGWRVTLSGPSMDGDIVYAGDARNAAVGVNMRRLVIPEQGEVSTGITGTTDVDPLSLPAFNVAVESFSWRGVELGQLNIETRPGAQGLVVERMDLQSDLLRLAATGDWRREGGQQVSRFDIDVTGGDLGNLFEAFGYAGNIAGGATVGKIRANWPGNPTQFALSRMQGKLSMNIGKGRLLDVEPGAGRVFGLLSVGALPRRLALDFRDLFQKGFSFDYMRGNFTLADGEAFTDDLVVEGPSARIEMAGRTGLVERDYDQVVTVVPQIGSTLPLAGAIAAGPGIGAALLLADKLFPQIGRIAQARYTLTGNWDEPVFTRVREAVKDAEPEPEREAGPLSPARR